MSLDFALPLGTRRLQSARDRQPLPDAPSAGEELNDLLVELRTPR